MNIALILEAKYPNLSPLRDFKLRDDGEGPYIDVWLSQDYPEPSNSDLVSWEKEFSAEMAGLTAAANRIYPSTPDQLDMLWHAMNSGEIPKADQWYETIRDVKMNNPKP